MKKPSYNPIIYSYLKRYQEDPSSRVFAPLSEAYRKAGLIDEAIEIAREGLRVHPNFVGGRVALARALFEKSEYEEVIQELSSVVQDVPDNLAAQRLMAESCLMVGRVTEALGAYKMLLFFSPDDPETAKIVQELEAQAYEQGALVLRTDPKPRRPQPVPRLGELSDINDEFGGFDVKPAGAAISDDPGHKQALWIRRIEKLQGLLQKVERYRAQNRRTG